MKRIIALSFSAALFFSSGAFAHHGHEDHSPTPPPASSPLCPVHFVQQNICADVIFLQEPTVGVSSDFRISFFVLDEAGLRHGIETQDVFVDLWMNMGSHGHGAPPLTHERLNSEEWLLKDVFFVMAGPWQVRLHFNGEQAILPVHAKK